MLAGAIIHSDRGSQYASTDFRALSRTSGFRQSMSGKGNCYDNAQAESFFSRFKAELIEGGAFENVEEARSEIFSYIEGYYNRVRIHSSLGNLSPMEFEAEWKSKRQPESYKQRAELLRYIVNNLLIHQPILIFHYHNSSL